MSPKKPKKPKAIGYKGPSRWAPAPGSLAAGMIRKLAGAAPEPSDEPLLLAELAGWSLLHEGLVALGPDDCRALLASLGGDPSAQVPSQMRPRADRLAVDRWIGAERVELASQALAWSLVAAGLGQLGDFDRRSLATALALDYAAQLCRNRETNAREALVGFGASEAEIETRLASARDLALGNASTRKLARAEEIRAATERRLQRERAEEEAAAARAVADLRARRAKQGPRSTSKRASLPGF